jgi:hypothetical protein
MVKLDTNLGHRPPVWTVGLLILSIAPFSLAGPADAPDEGRPRSPLNEKERERGPAALESPHRLTVIGTDGLLVTDGNLVRRVNRGTLEVEHSFHAAGSLTGIAVHEDRVFVGNEADDRIDVFSTDGRFLSSFDEPVVGPADFLIDSADRRLYVVAGREGAVKVFDLGGSLVATIPATGGEPLSNPTGIALYQPLLVGDLDGDGVVGQADLGLLLSEYPCSVPPCTADLDGDGDTDQADLGLLLASYGEPLPAKQLLVSDFGDQSDSDNPIPAAVHVYDLTGRRLNSFTGDFSRPQGLAVDAAGRIVVVDSLRCELLILNAATGEVEGLLGGFGSEPGQLKLPLDIVIDPGTNDFFVTNNRLDRLEVYRGGRLP